MKKYSINVSRVLDAWEIENIEAQVELEDITLRASEISSKPLIVKLRLEPIKIHGMEAVLVTGSITGVLIMSCHRCMENFEHMLDLRLEQVFTKQTKDLEESKPIEDDEIDIIPVIEEALALNLPIKLLCKEDCKGLCPGCGRNLNKETCLCEEKPIDLRWQKLGDYFKKDDNKEK